MSGALNDASPHTHVADGRPRGAFSPLPFLAALIPLATVIHALLTRGAAPTVEAHASAHDLWTLLLRYALLVGVGVMGFLLGAGHVLAPTRTAAHIGWAASRPFQFELGFANWALALIGVAGFWSTWSFWAATVLAFSTFYWGCAFLHWRELLRSANTAPGNAGFMLWWDTLFPPALLGLLWLSR